MFPKNLKAYNLLKTHTKYKIKLKKLNEKKLHNTYLNIHNKSHPNNTKNYRTLYAKNQKNKIISQYKKITQNLITISIKTDKYQKNT